MKQIVKMKKIYIIILGMVLLAGIITAGVVVMPRTIPITLPPNTTAILRDMNVTDINVQLDGRTLYLSGDLRTSFHIPENCREWVCRDVPYSYLVEEHEYDEDGELIIVWRNVSYMIEDCFYDETRCSDRELIEQNLINYLIFIAENQRNRWNAPPRTINESVIVIR
jgi:hypothetical protein